MTKECYSHHLPLPDALWPCCCNQNEIIWGAFLSDLTWVGLSLCLSFCVGGKCNTLWCKYRVTTQQARKTSAVIRSQAFSIPNLHHMSEYIVQLEVELWNDCTALQYTSIATVYVQLHNVCMYSRFIQVSQYKSQGTVHGTGATNCSQLIEKSEAF